MSIFDLNNYNMILAISGAYAQKPCFPRPFTSKLTGEQPAQPLTYEALPQADVDGVEDTPIELAFCFFGRLNREVKFI